MAVQTQIQTRRGDAATWTSTNPTLADGEIGFESDTNKFKIGTGSTAWASLPYASNVSPLTTKGDLYTYSTDNDRLAVGNNGETLVADSSTSTGLRWQVPVNVNSILNSAMEIWQRGTTFAVGVLTYTADRWQGYRASGGGTTVSRQSGTTGFQYAARIQRDSGNASTTEIQFGQNFESSNSYKLAGQTITFSFYARAGADFSAASSNLNLQVITGTGTDQNFISGYTGSAIPINTTKTLTTSWQRFQSTATLSSSLTQVGVNFYYTPVGTASTNDWFEVTGVQIEVGSIATPFQTATGTIQGELAACQRYFQKSYDQATTPGTASTFGSSIMAAPDATVSYKSFPNVIYPVTMRGSTTITIYNPSTGTAGLAAGVRNTQANTNQPLFVAYQTQNGFQSYIDNSSASAGAQLMFHYTSSSEL
jgi:hypothetical protein